jgi:hypothetical protein
MPGELAATYPGDGASILSPSDGEAHPDGERRLPMELSLIVIILLFLFGGLSFSRR